MIIKAKDVNFIDCEQQIPPRMVTVSKDYLQKLQKQVNEMTVNAIWQEEFGGYWLPKEVHAELQHLRQKVNNGEGLVCPAASAQ